MLSRLDMRSSGTSWSSILMRWVAASSERDCAKSDRSLEAAQRADLRDIRTDTAPNSTTDLTEMRCPRTIGRCVRSESDLSSILIRVGVDRDGRRLCVQRALSICGDSQLPASSKSCHSIGGSHLLTRRGDGGTFTREDLEHAPEFIVIDGRRQRINFCVSASHAYRPKRLAKPPVPAHPRLEGAGTRCENAPQQWRSRREQPQEQSRQLQMLEREHG